MQIIGIDPGQKGGIASLVDGIAEAYLMPDSVSKIVSMIQLMARPGCTLAVERSQPMPKQGVTSVFTYGCHYGGFEAIAACLKLPYISIRPAEWKKAMGLNSEKTHSIIEAERLFPSVELIPPKCRKPSDGIAEALLIAEYARRKLAGQL
jgi:crossover junction endodeoxyribonuclease RuvC